MNASVQTQLPDKQTRSDLFVELVCRTMIVNASFLKIKKKKSFEELSLVLQACLTQLCIACVQLKSSTINYFICFGATLLSNNNSKVRKQSKYHYLPVFETKSTFLNMRTIHTNTKRTNLLLTHHKFEKYKRKKMQALNLTIY